MTIRPKIRVLINLFCYCTRPFDEKLGSSLIYFFYFHTTIRPNYMVLFHYSFFSARPFDQKLGSTLICFSFVHDHLIKNKGPH